MIINWIRDYFKNQRWSEAIKAFNIIHIVCMIGMLFITVVANYFIEDRRCIYLSFSIIVLLFLTVVEVNRTGKKQGPVIVMSIIFNIFYLPTMFFLFDRYICVIPIYFIFGVLYTVLLLDIKVGLVLGIFESIFFWLVLYYGYKYIPLDTNNLTQREIYIRYYGAAVAVIVSGICAGAATRFRYLYYQREQRRAESLRAEAMDAYVAKDMFLINMSHEIRTPMNAIVGTANLLLDKEVNERVSESVYNILNSCNALLSIINELMDLSKTESGELEIYSTAYDFSELMLEIVNMMTVRLAESSLSFYVDINKDIPRNLYGDVSKIRQLFVNLLNNAIKFTAEGKITLRVDYRQIDERDIELIVDVEDTGCGIRKENLGDIFKRNVAVDRVSEESQPVRSLGIGLPLCADIADAMNGTISVQSKFEQGSVFTFKVPQGYSTNEALVEVPDSFKHYVLIFENDESHAEYVKKIIGQLSVRADIARTRGDFERLMSVNGYTHVFVSNDRYEECDKFLNSRLINAKIVAIVDIDDNVHVSRATTTLNRPLNIINIASLLNNETNSYVRDILKQGGFMCPHSTILVVDDNSTNLSVASSVIRKYGANVLTAQSGRDCLRILGEQNVDLVFLDYMMPEMNGIDTLNAIRKLPDKKYKSMPVIALTANVVSGAREMFLEAGFDEFLTKPIVIDKVEKALKKYLPKEQIEYKTVQEEINE